jgi:hypothetical protein
MPKNRHNGKLKSKIRKLKHKIKGGEKKGEKDEEKKEKKGGIEEIMKLLLSKSLLGGGGHGGMGYAYPTSKDERRFIESKAEKKEKEDRILQNAQQLELMKQAGATAAAIAEQTKELSILKAKADAEEKKYEHLERMEKAKNKLRVLDAEAPYRKQLAGLEGRGSVLEAMAATQTKTAKAINDAMEAQIAKQVSGLSQKQAEAEIKKKIINGRFMII